jgi:hypothetical protein
MVNVDVLLWCFRKSSRLAREPFVSHGETVKRDLANRLLTLHGKAPAVLRSLMGRSCALENN